MESHYESQEVFKLMMRDKETIAFTFGQSNSAVEDEITVDVLTYFRQYEHKVLIQGVVPRLGLHIHPNQHLGLGHPDRGFLHTNSSSLERRTGKGQPLQ